MVIKSTAVWTVLAFCLASTIIAEPVCNPPGFRDRQCADQPGLNYDEESCNDAQLQAMRSAGEHMISYIGAAKRDLARGKPTPFEFFLKPNDRSVVEKALDELEKILRRQSSAVWFTCKFDYWGNCARGVFAVISGQPNRMKEMNAVTTIHVCPAWFRSTEIFNPCDRNSGLVWKDRIMVMLHELLHIPYLTGQRNVMLVDVFDVDIENAFKFRYKLLLDSIRYQRPILGLEGGRKTTNRAVDSVVNWQWYIRAAWTRYNIRGCKDRTSTAYHKILQEGQDFKSMALRIEEENRQKGGQGNDEDHDELRKLLYNSSNSTDSDETNSSSNTTDLIDAVIIDDIWEGNDTITEINP